MVLSLPPSPSLRVCFLVALKVRNFRACLACHPSNWLPHPLPCFPTSAAVYGLTYHVLGSTHGNNGGGKWLLAHKDWEWAGEEPLPEVRRRVVKQTLKAGA